MRAGFLTLALAFAAAPVMAALPALPAVQDVAGAELQLFVENDMLAGTDRYYSNGIKLGGGIPFAVLQVPAREALQQLVDGADAVHLGLFLGQNLYTPRDIKLSTAQPNDRPWAGWLYLGGVAQRVKDNRLDTVELDIGMVGPAALGETTQANWHKMIGSPQPKGWSHQLPNEPAFQLAYLAKQKYGQRNVELIPHAGMTIGTVSTLARVGGVLRFGEHMSGFGPDTIEPGGAMLQNMRRASEAGEGAEPVRSSWEWYVFAGVDHRFVAHSIFLDGTVFRDSASVAKRQHVYDLSLGLSVRWQALRVSLTRIRRSPEFDSPLGVSAQTFDSLNIGLEF